MAQQRDPSPNYRQRHLTLDLPNKFLLQEPFFPTPLYYWGRNSWGIKYIVSLVQLGIYDNEATPQLVGCTRLQSCLDKLSHQTELQSHQQKQPLESLQLPLLFYITMISLAQLTSQPSAPLQEKACFRAATELHFWRLQFYELKKKQQPCLCERCLGGTAAEQLLSDLK